MVTVTLMKTTVAKNLSQSIIICVEHQHFSKSIRQPCQYPIFGGCPGIPWLPLRDATGFLKYTRARHIKVHDKSKYVTYYQSE